MERPVPSTRRTWRPCQRLAATVFLGSHTALIFGRGVIIEKADEEGPFTHVFLNKGALIESYDECILLEGLTLRVNGVDHRSGPILGLRGQVAFFHVRDLRIHRFRCDDLGELQYAIHVCAFTDILIEDLIIKGDKDGVHLGCGERFTIRDGVFETFDDAIALNAHDYDTGTPRLGWLEFGLIENRYDLGAETSVGHFARLLAGAWVDWFEGMAVQKSDTVISGGRLYRVKAEPDGRIYRSVTAPSHSKGTQVLDGISWAMVQSDVVHTAGVRDVTFRDISLIKPRVGFNFKFDRDHYNRSYYPGAPILVQQRITLENVRVMHDQRVNLLEIGTPADVITLSGCRFGNTPIAFIDNNAMPDFGPTCLNLNGSIFPNHGAFDLVTNEVTGKEIHLQTTADVVLHNTFSARIAPGTITIRSDLPGLCRQ
jgi:hypothetical protein